MRITIQEGFIGVVISLIVLAIMVVAFSLSTPKTSVGVALPASNSWISETATSGPIALTGTELRIIATSTARQWLTLSAGNGCSQGFYVSLANDKVATANNGIFVASSTMFEINPQSHSYTGSVRGLSNGGTCNINVTGE